MSKYKITEVTIVENELFDDEILIVRLLDEGGGEFFEVEDGQGGKIRLNPDEITKLVDVSHIMRKFDLSIFKDKNWA